MLTKSQIVTIIQNNLNHDSMYPIQLYLTKLIERENYGNGIERYRIYNSLTNSYITSLNDFISKITASEIEPYIDFSLKNENYTQSVNIKLKNFIVDLNKYSLDDEDLIITFGKELSKQIVFVMSNSNSTFINSLPLVIYEVKLV